MYIKRIILKDVRSIKDLDISLWDEWNQEPLKSVLLMGPNGSGKSTILEAISELWGSLATSFYNRAYPRNVLRKKGMAAIELEAFIHEKSLWLYWVSNKTYLQEFPEIREENSLQVDRDFATYSPSALQQELSLLFNLKERLELGSPSDTILPNLVIVGAENRYLPYVNSNESREPYPEPFYQWLVSYDANERWQGSVEAILRNEKVRNPKRFYDLVDQVNQFLQGKEISDFDAKLQLWVQSNGVSYPLQQLSSGEKQCLILLVMVNRWLMDGGIVLIDEPDLHLHVSLQRQFINQLQKLIFVRGGQLIVASHSPTLWEEYYDVQRIRLGLAENDPAN